MSVLKTLAARQYTCMVGGEQVDLRVPTLDERMDIRRQAFGDMDSERKPTVENVESYERACVSALMLTVTSPADITREEWERILVLSNDPETTAEYEGLSDLVAMAMRLCGFASKVEGDKTVDHVKETDAHLGDVPT